MYFFAASTLLLGALTGWAWGCAAMAAAAKARNMNVTAAVYQREESSLAGTSNPDQLFQIDIFRGVFLDPGSSAVFGFFLGELRSSLSCAMFILMHRIRTSHWHFFLCLCARQGTTLGALLSECWLLI